MHWVKEIRKKETSCSNGAVFFKGHAIKVQEDKTFVSIFLFSRSGGGTDFLKIQSQCRIIMEFIAINEGIIKKCI